MNIYELIVENIEKINEHFGLELVQNRKFWGGKCPIHGGDNPTALSFYTDGNVCVGSWRCHTQQCHEKYSGHSLGFMQGLLEAKLNKPFSKDEARQWCEKFFQQKAIEATKDGNDVLTSFINQFKPHTERSPFRMALKDFYSRLTTPAQYYLSRNYTEQTLDKFKVGYCGNPSKPMYERVLVPIIDNHDPEQICGFMGRSVFEKCLVCKGYHDPAKMCNRVPNPKWVNSDNFPSESSLYNFNRAKKFINDTGLAILVEGSPNVWRCDEAGFPMALGCYGAKFTDYQKNLLDSTGAHTIIGVPDNDSASDIFIKHIKAQCKFTHNIVIIEPSYTDDIGACNVETVKNILGPLVDKYNA